MKFSALARNAEQLESGKTAVRRLAQAAERVVALVDQDVEVELIVAAARRLASTAVFFSSRLESLESTRDLGDLVGTEDEG